MRINNNVTAMNAHRMYSNNNTSVTKSVSKLSSGYRINSSADDAAGLAISEKMRAQIRGLTMASKNSQDAVSLVQTAEGALQESHNILQRMRELAVQSSSDTNETTVDRNALNQEFQALKAEIDEIATTTRFNDQNLLDGTYAKTKTTAQSATAGVSSSWASTNIAAGTYTISFSAAQVSPEITGSAAALSTTSPSNKSSVDDSTLSGGFTLVDNANGKLVATFAPPGDKTEASNGQWSLSFTPDNADDSVGVFKLTNTQTGEVKTAAAATLDSSNATQTLDFGEAGKLTLTGSNFATGGSIGADDYGQMASMTYTLEGGVSDSDPVYEHTATFNGQSITVESGMDSLVFNGLSVKLESPLTVDSTDDASPFAGGKIEVEVGKGQGKELTIQSGANQGDELAITVDRMDTQSLGIATADISNRLAASSAITQVNDALNLVSTQRAELGALANRLEYKIANLDTSAENLTAAESRIRDVDMAKEMTNFTKNNILSQASTAMLAQANSLPQGVLQLLG